MAGGARVWSGRVALVSAAALSLALAVGTVSGAVVTGGTHTTGTHSTGTTKASGSHQAQAFRPPAIKHVWVIELENESIGETFGNPASQPYLATTLPGMGALLEDYYSVGHHSLDNYIAEISGQAPDPDTQDDCPVWVPFAKSAKVTGAYHQLKGNGCVFPAKVQTLGNQLSARHLSWAAYMQDMGISPKRDHTTKTKQGPACGHPKVGSLDDTETATAKDQYAVRHEGFMYFESVIGKKSYCDAHILSFKPLAKDLSKASTTPNFSWITPNLCNDGHDSPCANGQPGGLTSITSFLKSWLPKIMDSPAYKTGMIVITFDEASTSDSSACCGEKSGKSASHPNVAKPGLTGPGGGLVGAVVLSPFVKPGTVSTVKYNHYSLLRSIEDIFKLSHLGDAAMPQVQSFGPDVYTNP
jgi:phosphatidylinositol-3-phosphatase